MKNFIYIALFSILSLGAQAQIRADRQVLGSLGHQLVITENTALTATAGEAVVATKSSDSKVLTQGFHQPGILAAIAFDIETFDASCPTSTDGAAKISNLVGCRPPYSIRWSTDVNGPQVDRLGPGLYTVTVETSFCTLTQEFAIESGPDTDCRLLFFKAFSPNGDGKNDGWEIENIARPEFSDNHVEIFNRWGQSVWEGKGYNNTDVLWKGETKNGNKLSDGTYFYVATVDDVVYKGFIELTK